MYRKLAHLGHQNIYLENKGASEMWMSLHTLQENHKINNEIPSTRHYYLIKHVPLQKYYIKLPQPIGHHPRVSESRLQPAEYQIWSIFTSLHRHYKQLKTENGRGDRTNTSKKNGVDIFLCA